MLPVTSSVNTRSSLLESPCAATRPAVASGSARRCRRQPPQTRQAAKRPNFQRRRDSASERCSGSAPMLLVVEEAARHKLLEQVLERALLKIECSSSVKVELMRPGEATTPAPDYRPHDLTGVHSGAAPPFWRAARVSARLLAAAAADSSRELDVLDHDGHALPVDRAEVGVLEELDKVGLGRLLERGDRRRLPAGARAIDVAPRRGGARGRRMDAAGRATGTRRCRRRRCRPRARAARTAACG